MANGTHGKVTNKGYADISKDRWNQIFNNKNNMETTTPNAMTPEQIAEIAMMNKVLGTIEENIQGLAVGQIKQIFQVILQRLDMIKYEKAVKEEVK